MQCYVGSDGGGFTARFFGLGVSYRNGEMAFQEASRKEKPALI